MENVFRAYDIRGVYQKQITLDFAEHIGLSFGTVLGNKGTVVLGRDARHGGQELQNAVSKGLNRAGVDTVMLGMLPTPVINYCCAKEKASAGVIISASHNPPEYNGIRFRKGSGAGYPECIPDVKKTYFSKSWKAPGGGHERNADSEKVLEAYLENVVGKTVMKKPLKIVVDPGNGAACGCGVSLFKRLGCEVTAINDTPDGDFPGRSAYPNERTLGGLQEAVKKAKADMGVAYDGDADRVVFADDKGRVISAEEAGVLMVREILSEKKGEVALNVDCSMSVEEEVVNRGGTVKRIRVGDVFLADAVENGAIFAMESSSHFVVPKYFGFDDGLAVSAYLAQIVSESGDKLSELTEKVPKYPTIRKEMHVPDDKKFRAIEILTELFRCRSPLTIDGVKLVYPWGWVLARASNTQPMLRLTAEGKTVEDAEHMIEELEDAVRKCL